MATKFTDKCLEKAADDEPIFVLRAQDKLAPALVRQWAVEFLKKHGGILRAQGKPDIWAKFTEAMQLADQMEAWPTRKIAD